MNKIGYRQHHWIITYKIGFYKEAIDYIPELFGRSIGSDYCDIAGNY